MPTAQGGWEAYKILRMPPCKEPACNAGDTGDVGSVPGLGRSPGGGNGNLVQYSCLENPMDRGAWWATVRGVVKVLADLYIPH